MRERCPLCGELPLRIFFDKQAFCGNAECVVLTWNPSAEDGGPVSVIDLPEDFT